MPALPHPDAGPNGLVNGIRIRIRLADGGMLVVPNEPDEDEQGFAAALGRRPAGGSRDGLLAVSKEIDADEADLKACFVQGESAREGIRFCKTGPDGLPRHLILFRHP